MVIYLAVISPDWLHHPSDYLTEQRKNTSTLLIIWLCVSVFIFRAAFVSLSHKFIMLVFVTKSIIIIDYHQAFGEF